MCGQIHVIMEVVHLERSTSHDHALVGAGWIAVGAPAIIHVAAARPADPSLLRAAGVG